MKRKAVLVVGRPPRRRGRLSHSAVPLQRPTARLLVVLILLVCGGDIGRGTAQARQAMPQIAFHNGGIYVMSADGGDPKRLTDDPDVFPAWSPDGQQIAFMRSTQGPADIYVMDADGTNQRRLTGGDGPAWSPVPPSRN